MSVIALTVMSVTRFVPTLLEATTVHVNGDLQWEKTIPVKVSQLTRASALHRLPVSYHTTSSVFASRTCSHFLIKFCKLWIQYSFFTHNYNMHKIYETN